MAELNRECCTAASTTRVTGTVEQVRETVREKYAAAAVAAAAGAAGAACCGPADDAGLFGPPLYSDALGQPGTNGDTYLKMMRYNVQTLVKSLSQ